MLFATPPKINPADYLPAEDAAKVASVRLVSPPSQWDDEITQNVMREHPYIPQDQIVVNFRQRDDTNGYAIGSVGLANMPHISIPVIITNREMSPLDVMVVSRTGTGSTDVDQGSGDMTEDRVMPLTEENFAMTQDMSQIGRPVADQDIQGVGYTEDGYNMRLPFRGRTVVAEAIGATETQKAVLGAILSKDKQAAAGFLLNNTTDVLQSWLDAGAPRNGAAAKLASAQIETHPAKIASTFPKELLTSDVFVADVVVEGGNVKTAMRIDVVDLATPAKGTVPILVFSDSSYVPAPTKVATVDTGASEDARAAEVVGAIKAGELQRGTYLMFQLGEHFTRPAKLASIQVREDQRAVTLRLEDDLARSYSIVLDRRVKTASFSDGQWVLPMVSKVFRLAGMSEELPMPMEKVAEWFERRLPDLLVASDGQFAVSIRGEAFGGQMSETKMASVLSSWISNATELMEIAKAGGHVRFASDLPTTATEVIKAASALQGIAKLAKAALPDLSMPLEKAVKLAASIGDPQAVDAVLGTGFLTEDNLTEFVSMSDQLGEVVEKLARLLIAIRMGFPGDESATVVAMKSLQRVKERLEAAMTEVQA